jgi:hypothetical protein
MTSLLDELLRGEHSGFGREVHTGGRPYVVSGAWDVVHDQYVIVVSDQTVPGTGLPLANSASITKQDALMMNKASFQNAVQQLTARLIRELDESRDRGETQEKRLRRKLSDALHEAQQAEPDATLWWECTDQTLSVADHLIDRILRIIRDAEKVVV